MTHAVILAAILWPWPICETRFPRTADARTWQALKTITRTLELWDRDWGWSSDFRAEMVWARRTWDATRDFPPLRDAEWLPDLETCRKARLFNYEHQCWLENQSQICLHHDYSNWLEESAHLDRVWGAAQDVRWEPFTCHTRREALHKLKALLGNTYPVLPPPVPMWRFREVK